MQRPILALALALLCARAAHGFSAGNIVVVQVAETTSASTTGAVAVSLLELAGSGE